MGKVGRFILGFVFSLGLIHQLTFNAWAQGNSVETSLYKMSPYYEIDESGEMVDQVDEMLVTRENIFLYNTYRSEIEEIHVKVLRLLSVCLLFLVLLVSWFLEPIWRRFKIKQKIRKNMKRNRYTLQYQPIYHLKSHKIQGFEALLRLYNEDDELISPVQFIREIEDNGMLLEMSLWILKKAIKDYEEIQTYPCVSDHPFYVSVNISLSEIENRWFIDQAQKLLKQSNLGRDKICLEIIERIKMNQINEGAHHLALLKEAGFKVAMDDFGVDYSNLDLLLRLDTDVVKVDKFLVDGIKQDPFKDEIIAFIFKVAEIKNKSIVLEGVETKLQVQAIENYHYDLTYVQGYYFYKPLFKEEIKFIDS